ncbi:MAG: hypothetical protein AYK19_02365 [Theionarchaea archaeon DG-70-1]|nr:MAG: hypothetical protein AYK19_02365 [Theionarchaea archaeon DG-70-1]
MGNTLAADDFIGCGNIPLELDPAARAAIPIDSTMVTRNMPTRKKVIAYWDDASRYILAIGEFEHATGTNTINVLKEAELIVQSNIISTWLIQLHVL